MIALLKRNTLSILTYIASLSLFTEDIPQPVDHLKELVIQQLSLYVSVCCPLSFLSFDRSQSLPDSNKQKAHLTDFIKRREYQNTAHITPPKISDDAHLLSHEAVFPATIAKAIKESSPRELFQLTTEVIQQQYPVQLRNLMKKTNQIRQIGSNAKSDSSTPSSTSILPEFVSFIKVVLGVDMLSRYLLGEADPSALFEAAVQADPDEDRDDFEESLESAWTDLMSVSQNWVSFTRPAADLLTEAERSSVAYNEYLRLLNPPQRSPESAQPDDEEEQNEGHTTDGTNG